jgi:hypothetical protein
MAGIARTDIFFAALLTWIFAPLAFGVYYLASIAGVHREGPIWMGFIFGFIAAAVAAWFLIGRTKLFRRVRQGMSRWGVGVAQLTYIVYLFVFPVYLIIGLINLNDD